MFGSRTSRTTRLPRSPAKPATAPSPNGTFSPRRSPPQWHRAWNATRRARRPTNATSVMKRGSGQSDFERQANLCCELLLASHVLLSKARLPIRWKHWFRTSSKACVHSAQSGPHVRGRARVSTRIGTNTAIFSAVNSVLLKPAPVSQPRPLFLVHRHSGDWHRGLEPAILPANAACVLKLPSVICIALGCHPAKQRVVRVQLRTRAVEHIR